MTRLGILALLLAVAVLSAFAQLLFKLSARRNASLRGSFGDWRFMLGGGLFAVCPVLSYLALRQADFSHYYATTAFSQLAILVLAVVCLGERLDRWKFAGSGLILAGLIVYHL